MNFNEARQEILNIVINKFSLNICVDNSFDKKLFGGPFNLKARDMLILYFELEKHFKIKFPQRDIIEGKFSTLNEITDLVIKAGDLVTN